MWFMLCFLFCFSVFKAFAHTKKHIFLCNEQKIYLEQFIQMALLFVLCALIVVEWTGIGHILAIFN